MISSIKTWFNRSKHTQAVLTNYFCVIGAQKSGTSSLHSYLNQHPQLKGSNPKEVHFFDNNDNFRKGYDWYKGHFSLENRKKNFFYYESSPSYLYVEGVAERIFKFNPHSKILVVLRDPTARAYSAWNMYQDFSKEGNQVIVKSKDIQSEFYIRDEFPKFETVVKKDIERWREGISQGEPSIIRRGIYLYQLKRYFGIFGKENVLVIGFKDLIGDKQKETLNNILNFLNLPNYDWSSLNNSPRNKRIYDQSLQKEITDYLNDFYTPYNDELFKFLGFVPNW